MGRDDGLPAFLARARIPSAILAWFFTHSLRPHLAFDMAPLRPVAPFLGPISMKGVGSCSTLSTSRSPLAAFWPSQSRCAPASACEVPAMIEYFIGGAVALALLAYLTVALLRPERF
ncbi:K(+)-transporting ATPase subunit F [Sinorhizobium meliloti]|nr:K(+)-transporting ATPase subunit F [Sinorhizobium meliloti]